MAASACFLGKDRPTAHPSLDRPGAVSSREREEYRGLGHVCVCLHRSFLPPSSVPESLLLLPCYWTGPWTCVALAPPQSLIHLTYLPITSTAPQFPPHCKIPALSDNSHPPTLLIPELKSYLPLQPIAQVCSRFSSLPAPNLHLQSSAAHTSPGIFLFHSLNEHLIFLTNFPHIIASPCVQP